MSFSASARGVTPSPAGVLSSEFLLGRGIPLTQPAKGWITRAAFIARTRSSLEERQRYERWALHMVEDALAAPGGLASFPWAKTSPVMPPEAPDRTPNLLRNDSAPVPLIPPVTQGGTVQQGVTGQSLSDECLQRAPAELRRFVAHALAENEHSGRSMLDVLGRANELKREEDACGQQIQAPRAPRIQPSTASRQGASTAPSSRATKRSRPQESDPRALSAAAGTVAAGEMNQFFAFLLSNESPGATGQHGAEHNTIIGTSTSLERLYSRYEPTAAAIRPPSVLREAFAHVQRETAARERREGRIHALEYLNDQLKGMRQDLRVQNIVSSFAVSIYELHASVSLERGDIGEFNQCQSALKSLYASPIVDKKHSSAADFFYYRLVYLSLSRQYDALSTELITYTNSTRRPKGQRGVADVVSRKRVRSCLQLCSACEDGDVAAMCKALSTFSSDMSHLVRIYLPRLRVGWIDALLRATKGEVLVSFLALHLGFVGMPSSLEKVTGGKASPPVWLDGSPQAAEVAFTELFTRLKVALPGDFSFMDAVHSASFPSSTVSGRRASLHTVDAGTAYAAVQTYLAYLMSRRDVTLGS